MKTAAISKLKATLSEYIALVKRGEEVVVTERGRPVALIVPIAPEAQHDEHIRELVRRGLVRPGRGKVTRALDELPICSVPEGLVLKIVGEEREDRV